MCCRGGKLSSHNHVSWQYHVYVTIILALFQKNILSGCRIGVTSPSSLISLLCDLDWSYINLCFLIWEWRWYGRWGGGNILKFQTTLIFHPIINKISQISCITNRFLIAPVNGTTRFGILHVVSALYSYTYSTSSLWTATVCEELSLP